MGSYPTFSPLLINQRYLSVALVLGSPPAGVTRYPCPAEPGLSSSSAFRHESAAVRPGRGNIVTQESQIVKHLANFPHGAYTIGTNASGRGAVNWCLSGCCRKNTVIANQRARWRGNPPVEWNRVTIITKNRNVPCPVGQLSIPFPSTRGIATPVCGLVRNDRKL